MLIRRRWRRFVAVAVVVAAVVVLGVATLLALYLPSRIEYYRVVDDKTLSVGTITGHNAWTRVTALTETPTTVSVTVGVFLLQLGGTADGVPALTEVTLHDPLGVRKVIDGTTGQPVKQCDHVPAYPTDCF